MEHATLAAWRRLGLTEDTEAELEKLELLAQEITDAAWWRDIDDSRQALAKIILQERGVQPGPDVIG